MSESATSRYRRFLKLPWLRNRKERSKKRLGWRQSWVFRSAAFVSLILLCGFAASTYIANQGVSSIAKIAHRDDVEQSMGAHLALIKKHYQLQQIHCVQALQQVIDSQPAPIRGSSISSNTIQSWLDRAKIDSWFNVTEATIRKANVTELQNGEAQSSKLRWLGQEDLYIYGYVINFPKGSAYTEFRNTENLLQNYQIIGNSLHDDIQPAMFRANVIVLSLMFITLALVFWYAARRFKERIESVISGFSVWTHQDADFRFEQTFTGELSMITEQFNAMADVVEENRQRNLYLEKLASWQTIAKKLAHEIKNPLTPIQMMVSQLHRRYQGEDPAFKGLLDEAQSIISEEVAGLRRLVDNFSEFAQLPEPKLEDIDLVVLINHAATLQQAAFSQHQIQADHGLAKAMVPADEDLLRQVLINLIKNAAEAADKDTIIITLSIEDHAESYIIEVRDNGPGIPEELRSRVFEAYFTTKHTGPSPGMGLGLAICQKIIMEHSGHMSVTSKPGDTRFRIRIPKQTSAQGDG